MLNISVNWQAFLLISVTCLNLNFSKCGAEQTVYTVPCQHLILEITYILVICFAIFFEWKHMVPSNFSSSVGSPWFMYCTVVIGEFGNVNTLVPKHDHKKSCFCCQKWVLYCKSRENNNMLLLNLFIYNLLFYSNIQWQMHSFMFPLYVNRKCNPGCIFAVANIIFMKM